MKKLIAVSILSILCLGGCIPLMVAGVGAAAGSVYLRYKGMDKEADTLDAIVEEIGPDVEKAAIEIEKAIEDSKGLDKTE